MDFQKIVDSMTAMTCVVSVERLPDGGHGKFRIVTGNKAYIDSIEHPAPGAKMLKDKFIPNSEYTDYLTRDMNFEDYCYRAAVGKKCLHSYVHPDRMDVWLNMMFLPVGQDEGDLSYCLYIMEINFEASSERLSNISSEVATSVLDTCIRLRGTNDFRSAIKDVIEGIRDLCDAEHCCILLMHDHNRTCEVLGEAFGKGSKLLPMDTYLDGVFYDIADSWKDTIAGSNCIIAKDEQDMEVIKERNPVWYESVTSAGAYNIVLFPLKSRNQLLGYMWALNFNKERAVKIKETLEVTTFIVGSELGNYFLLDRLRLLGTKDMLTGVMNRNEMNNVVDELSHGCKDNISVGVIFADLNGLKTVNDLEGHNAGDLLLKNAAGILRRIFEENEIFRAGGDEFSIIITDITEEELEERIERIRQESVRSDNVSFALGGAVEKNSVNVRMALRRADERMYEDKRKYYEQFPEQISESRMNRSRMDHVTNVDSDESNRERDIFHKMNYDFLTGLPSMTYFFKLAESGRKSMHDQDIPSALLFINLTGLKFFNQKYGFAEGDALIKELATIISGEFGEEKCSRFGQDHFAVYTESADLELKLARIFKEMKTANNGKTLPVRIGIYPDSMGIVETSLACDRAKYACDVIRNDYESYFKYFDKDMLQREINRQYIVDNIDKAIDENWITAFYQPIVRATNRKVCDEEALARWIDPVRGMLSPADFIPILEDTRLIYKVDLHIVDIILERIRNQRQRGMNVVPISVNLSRTDFESCDIVEEICNRVDAAGVSRDLITIEITESVIGENFNFMKEQISRLQNLGFKVWMDDFGSGYSSLDLLQELRFDLIKFDMRFMRQFDSSPRSRVILTELMRMAASLDIETVTEGVETAGQADFLSEIGCTKMQGYYFNKPIPLDQIYERYRTGKQIGFEDPADAEYNKIISSINLYDLGAVSNEDTESIKHYFNTLPMAVIEFDGTNVRISRCNRSYRDFIESYSDRGAEGISGSSIANSLSQCRNIGQKIFINEITDKGEAINALVRRIADNPAKGISAYAVAILGITPKNEQVITYTGVARALSADYIDIYHVELDTEKFTQLSHGAGDRDISVERKGEEFFDAARKDALKYLYEEDKEDFIKTFTKENVIKALDEHGAFTNTYRLVMDGRPQYVNMKAVRMNDDGNDIIIGVNNVDAQMREKETLERLREESTTYSRISALMGDFIAIYTVDPDTCNYVEYNASSEYQDLQTPKSGDDFFGDSIRESEDKIVKEDYSRFMEEFTKEKLLEKTAKGEIFIIYYRLMLGGVPVKICLRAGLVKEKDGPKIIVGISRATDQ